MIAKFIHHLQLSVAAVGLLGAGLYIMMPHYINHNMSL